MHFEWEIFYLTRPLLLGEVPAYSKTPPSPLNLKRGVYQQINKKSVFLFGFMHNLHYLCSVINKERNEYESNNVNGQYL